MASIELHLGQIVPYPPAPEGVAQVAELGRSRVWLLYPRKGRICRAVVSVTKIQSWQRRSPLLFAVDNPLGRGIRQPAKAKFYKWQNPRRATEEAIP